MAFGGPTPQTRTELDVARTVLRIAAYMSRLRRLGTVIVVIIVVALALVGALTITRGTPVGRVVTLSDSGPPAVSDSLFERTFELFTGTHIFAGNTVEQALNGDGTYPRLWADLRSA